MARFRFPLLSSIAACWLAAGCLSPEPEGLALAEAAFTSVKFDFFHRPLPDIPLPNDIATRYDPSSATGLRINVATITPTKLEQRLRENVNRLDGWGLFQHITVPFSDPIDMRSVLTRHDDVDYEPSDDAVYLIDVDRDSPEFGQLKYLDVCNGNFPVVLERLEYYKNDPRNWLLSLMFEEEDEDLDGDGVLDLGGDADGNGIIEPGEWPEDTDADGVLDKPNYRPGANPARDDLPGRADALMYCYEGETNTLIARPMVPLRERTTYAVVVTRRILDMHGQPVGSPFRSINHVSQNEALAALPDVLPAGLDLDDIAFTYAFTTQSAESHWVAVRDGLYGHGAQAHLGDDFQPVLDELAVMRDPSLEYWQHVTNPHIIYYEDFEAILGIAGTEILGMDGNSRVWELAEGSLRYVDYLTVGTFTSPQLFPRYEEDGETWLHYDDQIWPPDLDRVPAPARGEQVHFTIYMPRKEVSPRGEGKPAPIMLHGHGYTSNRLESLLWSGFFARHGIATMAIECPSHGVEMAQSDWDMVNQMLEFAPQFKGFINELLTDRAHDQNGDGEVDSGADFWTSYLLHTRDMVRQCTVDHMQLVRLIRSFDGVRRWAYDVDGDGQGDLAGDFDGDGVIDIGQGSVIGMTGSSLGGIMASMVGSLEPELTAAVPICGGGGLTDVGNRSIQGGVREAVQLRLMTPIYVGTRDNDTGEMLLETVVPDLNNDRTIAFATAIGVNPGDTVVGVNLVNLERGCSYVTQEGTFRLAIPSDKGDATEFHFYRGPQLAGGHDCELRDRVEPYLVIDSFDREVTFQAQTYAAEQPFEALAEGLALKRGSPEFRRLLTLAQLAIDPGDPGVATRHMTKEPLYYPGTNQTTGTHTLIVTTVGDMNVPASVGVSQGRAAGYIDYLTDHPDYGKPANQVLLDTYMAEAVDKIGRYHNNRGEPVHYDVDNYSMGDDIWAEEEIPRLDPPLRLYGDDGLCAKVAGKSCGQSGSLFPYADHHGKHDLPLPGDWPDKAVDRCTDGCQDLPDDEQAECRVGCKQIRTFDMGLFFYNLIGRYVASLGAVVSDTQLCNGYDECEDLPEPPPKRSVSELP